MSLLKLRSRDGGSGSVDVAALDSAVLGGGASAVVSVDGAAGPPTAVTQPVSLISREPPLLLAAVAQDAPALGELLMRRSFTVALGDRVAKCRLHATADAGECAVLVGRVLAV